ncbi:MAG: FAD synthetase family protein [Rikenellaceae bacterium]|jgi:cytidyltransferase-like protein|nr:FAD synthetase family protein [Rikenellaceae bacterium]
MKVCRISGPFGEEGAGAGSVFSAPETKAAIRESSLDDIRSRLNNPVVTVGSFDGVHRGHRKILERLKEVAAELGGESVAVTFDPHPRRLVDPEPGSLRLLNSLQEKILLLDGVGIDNLVIIPFTPGFSQIPSDIFLKDYLLLGLGAKALVMGYNHHFGHNREGRFDSATGAGIMVCEVPQFNVENDKVSSTAIRQLIREGKMSLAAYCLDAPYPLMGLLGPDGRFLPEEPLKQLPPPGNYPVKVHGAACDCSGNLHINAGQRVFLSSSECPLAVGFQSVSFR